MKLNATKLRANLYKVIDQVIQTGIPVEIERNGKKVRLVSMEARNKLDQLEPHPDVIVGNPENLVHMDWSSYWKYDDDIS